MLPGVEGGVGGAWLPGSLVTVDITPIAKNGRSQQAVGVILLLKRKSNGKVLRGSRDVSCALFNGTSCSGLEKAWEPPG